jgi:hypothetical protein
MKAIITLENEDEIKKFIGQQSQEAAVTETDDEPEFTQEEAERYKVASDLATVCDYLEDSEIIKIRLIVTKCEARMERDKAQ